MRSFNESHPDSGPLVPIRVARYLLLLILLGLAVHFILPQLATLNHSLHIIRGMALWAVGLAVAAQILSYLGSGYLVKKVVAVAGQRLSITRATLIFTAASSIGLIAGGAVASGTASYRWLHRCGVSTEGAVLAGSLPTLFNEAALTFTGILGLLQLFVLHELTTLQIIGFGLTLTILMTLAGAILWGMYHRPQLTKMALWIARRLAGLRRRPYDPGKTEESMERLFHAWDILRRGGWRGPALGAALNIAFDILTLYFLFMAAGHVVGPAILLAGYGLPLLLGKISFLPGGVGIVEGTMTALYTSLGVPIGITVVVILSYRVLSFWLPTLTGFPLVPYLHHVCNQG